MSLLWVVTMKHATSTYYYPVQRCLAIEAKLKNIMDFKQQRVPAAPFRKSNQFLAHPPRTDSCNEFKKWIKPRQEFLCTINWKKSEATRNKLQNSRKFKMIDSRTHKGQFFLHSKSVQILEKIVQFPRIIVEKFLKNDNVDLHPNMCLHQPLRNGAIFAGICSNEMKYSTPFPLTSSEAQLGHHNVATVRQYSTSSCMEIPDSNVFSGIDGAFLCIFGCEENKDLLISLLNSILLAEDHVKYIQFLNSYTCKKYVNRLDIVAIEATDNRGEKYNIEIQIIDDFEYHKKPLAYWSGHFSKKRRKTIRIHILGYTYLPESKEIHNTRIVKEEDSNVELHTIELEKFHDNDKEGLQELINKIKTPLDKWLAFFTAGLLLDKDNLPEELDDAHIKIALGQLYNYYFYSEERQRPKEYLKSLRDGWGMGRTRMNFADIWEYTISMRSELEAEKANEELERMRVDTTKLMLKYNVPVHEIQKVCGLTKEEIISLKNF